MLASLQNTALLLRWKAGALLQFPQNGSLNGYYYCNLFLLACFLSDHKLLFNGHGARCRTLVVETRELGGDRTRLKAKLPGGLIFTVEPGSMPGLAARARCSSPLDVFILCRRCRKKERQIPRYSRTVLSKSKCLVLEIAFCSRRHSRRGSAPIPFAIPCVCRDRRSTSALCYWQAIH